jgi:hypothetical protein
MKSVGAHSAVVMSRPAPSGGFSCRIGRVPSAADFYFNVLLGFRRIGFCLLDQALAKRGSNQRTQMRLILRFGGFQFFFRQRVNRFAAWL